MATPISDLTSRTPLTLYLKDMTSAPSDRAFDLVLQSKIWRPLLNTLLQQECLMTTHLVNNIKINAHELSEGNATSEYAYRGFGGSTVADHFLTKHKYVIKYPLRPCVVTLGGND